MNSNKTFFIKPSKPLFGERKLDPVLATENVLNGVETNIILDTNILIRMEKVVKEGNKWSSVKKYGLNNLVKLLKRCPPHSVCISPGFALSEMPPAAANQSRIFYENFCAKHLRGFVDAPNSLRTHFRETSRDYGFKDLPLEARGVLAIPFVSILYLNLIYYKKEGSPIKKFKTYLDKIESTIDILSATEIEIAKYCFSEIESGEQEILNLRKNIRANFIKTGREKRPKNANEVLKIGFNGACDIGLLTSANVNDQNGLDNVIQDSWIATGDKKLAAFSDVFHHVNVDGEAGKYAASSTIGGDGKNQYWHEALIAWGVKSLSRRAHYESKKLDFDELASIADKAILEIEKEFG